MNRIFHCTVKRSIQVQRWQQWDEQKQFAVLDHFRTGAFGPAIQEELTGWTHRDLFAGPESGWDRSTALVSSCCLEDRPHSNPGKFVGRYVHKLMTGAPVKIRNFTIKRRVFMRKKELGKVNQSLSFSNLFFFFPFLSPSRISFFSFLFSLLLESLFFFSFLFSLLLESPFSFF